MPNTEWVGTPNFTSGRKGRTQLAIVDHITAGYYPGCLEWMQNPASQGSAHYLVLRDGRILQLVREGDTAWHAGIANNPNWSLYDGMNPNRYTIGIEHEGMPGDGLTEVQYQSSLWLHKDLTQKYGIPIDTDHIIGHYRIDSINRANCPGPGFPWERLFSDLKGEDEVLEHAVVYWSEADSSVADMVAQRLGGCAKFNRNRAATVHSDAMKAKHLVVIGGPEVTHPNVKNCCGSGAPETAILAAQYAQTL